MICVFTIDEGIKVLKKEIIKMKEKYVGIADKLLTRMLLYVHLAVQKSKSRYLKNGGFG